MRRRAGFSLLEMMIAVTLLLLIMGTAVQFLRRQSGAVGTDSQRMDALANAEFATSQIERELREAGVGVADQQPMLVQMDSMAITFNANITSADPKDVKAVYHTADVDPAEARVMLPAEAMALPNSNPVRMYPALTYMAAIGVPSSAETISYYLRKDTAATIPNTFALWRRVNARPSTLVARNLVRSAKDPIPFFTYYKQDQNGRLVAIPTAPVTLPIYHDTLHGASSDTGKSALTDSVRVVRLHFTALTVDPRAGKDSMQYRVVESRVRLLNAGLLQLDACGEAPATVGPPSVSQAMPGGVRTVTITWGKAKDDGGGERDIERYAIFRRPAAGTEFGDPISTVPAGSLATSYTFTDATVQPGTAYVYGIASQDCTPKMSGIAVSLPITVAP